MSFFNKIVIIGIYLLFSSALSVQADNTVREAQRLLNGLGLDAGPVDGAWGPRTETALITFYTRRGLTFDGNFDQEELFELRGQTVETPPDAEGLDLCQIVRLPSVDSFVLNPNDPSEFTLRLRGNDYDAAEYRDQASRMSVYSSSGGINFRKQRAELSTCSRLPFGGTFTLDLDFRVSNASAGTFFQIHAGGPNGSASLQAYQDSIRLIAGRDLNNVAVYRGDWLGEWQSMRLVFRIGRANEAFYRFYINDRLTLDTEGRMTDFGFNGRGARLNFGLYRGNISTETSVTYRNVRLHVGDLGAP